MKQRIRKITGHWAWDESHYLSVANCAFRNIGKPPPPLQAHRLYKMCSTVAFEQQVVTEAEMYFTLPQAEVGSGKIFFTLMGLPHAQCFGYGSGLDPDSIR
jgi:hypothetical protein